MNSIRRAVLALALALVVGGLVARTAAAGVPSDQLRMQVDRVLKVLEDTELKKETRAKDRRLAVRKIANEIFDFGETARRSLGRHWQARTPAEREEFVQLFSDLLERSYISRVELYGGEKIQYLGDTIEGDQAKVQTKLLTKSGSDIPIEYRMHRKGERWLVYDVSIEGVSLVANYRTQFNKIIQTTSYQELVRKMKTKQDELASGQSS
ncbi:MAG TPA: ABC transporter substrate-binding protein [Methylomirabilota bacterium]|nr:ABC transporter substrate-binding protein [Methylomirabilota bacterium]